MPRRASFGRESVLEAAFALAREKGWSAVTARAIAKRLGSSTMPIYSSLRSMEEIKEEVRKRAEALLVEFQSRPCPDYPSLGLALGYVSFAEQEPRLFRFLYVEAPRRAGKTELDERSRELENTFQGVPGLREAIEAVPELRTSRLLVRVWIFVHGLASLVSSGALDLGDDELRQLLLDAGAAFVMQERGRGDA